MMQQGSDSQGPDVRVEPLEQRGRSLPASQRKLLFAGLAAALVVALLVAGLAMLFALRGPRGGSSTAGGVPTSTARTLPTATLAASATPTNAPFVCANPAGSQSTYVFINIDRQLYRVTGCANPVRLTSIAADTRLVPLAFSPTRRWLMVVVGPSQQSESGSPPSCLTLLDPQTGALTKTRYCEDMSMSPAYPIDRFIDWVDDATFLVAEFEQPANGTSPVKILRVSTTSLASTSITTLTWVASEAAHGTDTGIKLRGGFLYYGGYASASEGGAWLHRVALADGSDSKLFKLGLTLTGGCQVYEGPCNWTGPWDISADGTRVVYHNPGPTISRTDTANPPETPLYISNPDGSAALKLTSPTGTTHYMSTPALSPSGAWVTAPNSNWDTVLLATDGSGTAIPLPYQYGFAAWGADSKSAILGSPDGYAVYTLATRAVVDLAPGTKYYVWAA